MRGVSHAGCRKVLPGGRHMRRVARIALLLPLLLANPTAGDDAVVRYVAQEGDDQGDCALPVRPCRTVQYALGQAGKGDEIRVASGTYALEDTGDSLEIVASAVEVRGGYDRFDHFIRQSSSGNRTVLTGVPVAMRGALEAQGFHVIADAKSDDPAAWAAVAGLAVTQTGSGAAQCTGNAAGAYACKDVDLLSHMARSDLSSAPYRVADVWGLVDLNTEREYALLGLTNGLAVIDVTEPTAPFEVGTLRGASTYWRDVKIVQRYAAAADRWHAYAYVSAESGGRLTVVDLAGLPNRVSVAARTDASAHNLHVSGVDYGTGVPLDGAGMPPLLHVSGSARNRGAVRSFDVSDPRRPKSVASLPGGYSHDAVSVLTTGDRAADCKADTDVCEVLVDFNELEIALWDFSDRAVPALLSSTTYANARYVHSGWLTEDGRYLFAHDEFDERQRGLKTTVRVFDLADLESPRLVRVWSGPTEAIDHNGYVRGNRYYMSTYTRGLTILDIADPLEPVEVGLFDTHPASDSNYPSGAWGVYPFLPSGTVLVSDRTGGLFVVDDRTRGAAPIRVAFTSASFGGEEGDELSVEVARHGRGGAVSVDYAVLVGSAGPADLRASSGTLHWPAAADDGADVEEIAVSLLRDDLTEPVERAFVRLANPQGGAVLGDVSFASVFVGDPGRGVSVGFAESSIEADEGAKQVVATVKRLGSPVGDVSVAYETHPVTAAAGEDYVAQAGTLAWTDGDASGRTILVPLVPDQEIEPAEGFEIRLASAVGAVVVGDGTATVEIEADNRAPTFAARSPTPRSVAENAAVGTAVGAPVNATDPDGDALRYSLGGNDAGSFTLGDGGQLRTGAVLDYEARATYSVIVAARDADGASASIEVAIAVTDESEAPSFPEGASTTRSVAENTPSGTAIGAPVVATDPDGDALSYELGGADAASFTVGADGQLRVEAALDYETRSTYAVTVTADDGRGGSAAIEVTVEIADVVDENKAPTFDEGASTTRSVAENTHAGTAIGTPVAATDPDRDALTYRLGGNDAGSFALGDGAQLQTRAALDYETKSAYSVAVTADDGEGGSATIEVSIAVTNVDERPGAPTNLTATAHRDRGVELAWTAPEEVGDGIAGYRVQRRAPGEEFRNVADTARGETTYVDADVTAGVTYRYRVRTLDGDQRSRPSNVAKVRAGGNQPPTFSEGPSTTRRVEENAAAGTAIGEPLTATDPDGDVLTYRLGGNDAASFALVAGAQLQTRAALDYGTKSAYSVTVTADDGAGGSAAIEVAISVIDVYERPGAPTNLTATAKRGVGIELSWTAPEQVGDGIVGYFVQRRLDEAGDDFRTIAKPGRTGTAHVDADVASGTTYRYRVQAFDGTRRSKASNEASATVAGNRPPTFSEGPSTTRSVEENAAAGTSIGAPVTATDPDGDALTYTLQGTDAARFALGEGGQLQTRAALDYEARAAYSLTVGVDDGDGGTASIDVAVGVTNVDERPGQPTNLTATARPGAGIELSWTAPQEVGDGIVGYRVQRRLDQAGNEFGNIADTQGVGTRYVDATVSAGVTYRYRVRTLDGDQRSRASNVVTATAAGE